MNRNPFIISLILCVIALHYCLPTNAQRASAILGEWHTNEKDAKIVIYSCQDRYCGKIAWLKDDANPEQASALDTNNPDASQRSRKLLGISVLTGLTYEGEGKWEDGRIYDPKSGKTFDCEVFLEDNKRLEVRGFIGFSLIGRSEIWHRVQPK